MGVIDFTDLKKRKKTYAGANGNKISVIYEGEQYMLKFPPQAKLNKGMSYSNSCFSEYLGCQIYESIGIPVQKTLMGIYTVKGKQKIVVACGDFTEPGVSLQDFASLKNRMIDSERQGYGTELIDILQTIDEQTLVDRDSLLERFWDMFIVDAFIGNWDRHNGNWGFLYDDRTDEMTLAPVYDCGSCLYPQADEKIMEAVLSDSVERNHRIYNIPLSAIMQEGRKIKYFDYISSLQNEECNRALKRIVPRIDMEKIKEIIDHTPFISDLQKKFYLTMLTERKTHILDFSLTALMKKEPFRIHRRRIPTAGE
ncbi:HipA-like C-terminal domain-containing protein [Eubacterium pyruvativorans]|uniref:HipA-like C-terminal domain-containing protein n=1 Tax=Eubacterium pyruvativorans TaxID=155865 RepID=A0A1I7I8T0_9FIRM|nr:HipA domain-containing protein [Eubacterium pyruvativorans]SFO38930.1 HipA-like C-terminal domain-containing protein [Eubacterium pyruvativorans]SFU69331.1 HipA-like C-terminal domain-containing protein [Eubacterium pyruvativorans]